MEKQLLVSVPLYSCLDTFWFPSNISTGWLFIWCITLSDTWTIMGPSAGYWHCTASQRLSCSCELVLSSIHSHSPQHLPPYQLSEENMPTWLWEVVWNVIISLPPPPPPPPPLKQAARQESDFIEDFTLHPWVRSFKFMAKKLIWKSGGMRTKFYKGRYVFNWGVGLGNVSSFFWKISWPSSFLYLVNTWPSPILILSQ